MNTSFIHPDKEAKKNTCIKVALIGNPNSGKSTLFNVLTGLNQSTANFPGATVDKKTGIFQVADITVKIIDLPGAYSLHPKSMDEQIAVDILKDKNHEDYPDLLIYVADASNLKRSLFLATQIIDKKFPIIIALNMMDTIQKKGISINLPWLAEQLGARVIPISARNDMGIDALRQAMIQPIVLPKHSLLQQEGNLFDSQLTIERYRIITQVLSGVIQINSNQPNEFATSKADRILTHKVWGYAIFLLILFLIFQSVFVLASYPMQWIETLFSFFTEKGASLLPKSELSDLLVNGILSGLSGIAVFIPQIALLFFFISILEDTGYMARVSFIMDRIMRKFGLNGRSIIPLLSGVACAVPAIMGTRTISNRKERIITLMVTPLMSCSARLPVYTLLIALVIPSKKILGLLDIQGMILMALYLIGFVAAIASAWVMKYLLRSTERSYFIMELPTYRSPRWSNIGLAIIDRVKVFLTDAGKIIIAISILLWYLSSHAPGNALQEIEKTYPATAHSSAEIAAKKLEASYAGRLGKFIEPAIRPLGFDWKVGIALITSFAAREVFVGTMATIYSASDEHNDLSIREKMQAETNPLTGKPVYTLAVGLSLMLFYAFAMQCMSTLAVVYRETKSWKWPLIQFAYMSSLAYLSAFAAFQLLH